MELRCRHAVVACLLTLSLLGVIFVQPGGSAARTRSAPRMSLSAFQCPPGMTEFTLVTVDCDSIGDGIEVEIISIEGSQPKVTLAEAQRDGDIYRWEVKPSDAEIDNWGIRQTVLPPGSNAYLIQGETVTVKPTPLYDYRFTTSEEDPQIDLSMFIFSSAAEGIIIPPSQESSSTQDRTTSTSTGSGAIETEPDSSQNTAQDEAGGSAAVEDDFARDPETAEETRTIRREPAPVRLAADASAVIVDVLANGEVVGVLSGPIQIGESNWYEVESAAGAIGWIESSAFDAPTTESAPDESAENDEGLQTGEAPAQPATVTTASEDTTPLLPGDRAMVNDPPLNLRFSPGVESEVLDSLAEGQLLQIDAEAGTVGGYAWFAVSLLPDAAVSGYVAGDFIEKIGFLGGESVAVDADSANVRTQPSTSADIVGTLPSGSQGTVLDGPTPADGFDWYQIQFSDDQSGWIAGSLLVLSASSASEAPASSDVAAFRPGAWVTVVDPPVNLRLMPGLESAAVEALDEGDVLIVLDGPESVDGYAWYMVEAAGIQGWVAGEFLGGGFLAGENVRVFDGPIYLRSEPGIDADIIWHLDQDETAAVVSPAPIIGGDYLWIEVKSADGSVGYVATEFIEPAE